MKGRPLKRFVFGVVAIIGVVLISCAIFLYWASRGYDAADPFSRPEINETLLEANRSDTPPGELRIMTFNVAYGRGPVDDVGDRRSEEEIRHYLDELAEFLRRENPDVVALQEVDFYARRTHYIDELAFLADEAGYPYRCRVTTWQRNYVPYPYWPISQHIGRVHSGNGLLSRYPIIRNERHVLPQADACPWWYKAFYGHRAVQSVLLDVGNLEVQVYNCHLESYDTTNRVQQAERVVGIVDGEATDAWIVLGDMNALPPEAPRFNGFVDEPDFDGSNDATIERLRRGLGVHELASGDLYRQNAEATFTFPADAPTRRLDYIFVADPIDVLSAEVVSSAGAISDHLPVAAHLRVRPDPR